MNKTHDILKVIHMKKDGVKLLLFADNMILYRDSPKVSIKNLANTD
jgi:hypothetical protein